MWLTLPFYDFCGFRSVTVNIVYKLQFFYIYNSSNVMFCCSSHARHVRYWAYESNIKQATFTARRYVSAICTYAMALRLSVTGRRSIKMAKHVSVSIRLNDSLRILVFSRERSWRNCNGVTHNESA